MGDGQIEHEKIDRRQAASSVGKGDATGVEKVSHIIKDCIGCDNVTGNSYCRENLYPMAHWSSGKCLKATHLKEQRMKRKSK